MISVKCLTLPIRVSQSTHLSFQARHFGRFSKKENKGKVSRFTCHHSIINDSVNNMVIFGCKNYDKICMYLEWMMCDCLIKVEFVQFNYFSITFLEICDANFKRSL